MGRNGLEGGGSISEATKDDGRRRKCDERQREVAEECCVLKHIFGGWNGYLRINDDESLTSLAVYFRNWHMFSEYMNNIPC